MRGLRKLSIASLPLILLNLSSIRQPLAEKCLKCPLKNGVGHVNDVNVAVIRKCQIESNFTFSFFNRYLTCE